VNTCTILVPHVEAPGYLAACIRSIKKHVHPLIRQDVIIVDQSGESTYRQLEESYSRDPAIKILRLPLIDAGYPIDEALKYATGDYFCSLDCDAFPDPRQLALVANHHNS